MHGANTIKTVLLLGLLSGVLIVGGRALGGRNGIYIGLALAVVMNFARYFFSDKIALAIIGAAADAKPRTRTSTGASRRWCETWRSA